MGPSSTSCAPRLRNDDVVAGLDTAAFEQLYERLERPLYNAAYRYVWHAEDAHDVVQDAFMKIWDARARIRPDTAAAYAWRAVLNTAAKRRRYQKLRAFVGLEQLHAHGTPDEALVNKLEDARVRKAVDALPEELKRVVLLTEIGGLAHGDVAAVLQVAVGTVASRRSRAFERLRTALGADAVAVLEQTALDATARKEVA
jgi:RNA polymerase sigma-70 factor (ECF subfamily)